MKKAFTMLELVFIIVVIGILAAVIIPSTRTNNVAEKAVKLVSDIRYTQHLAMVDDKFDSTLSNWFRNRWQIVFEDNKYSIVSDNDTTYAKDPQTKNNIEDIELKGVTVNVDSGCDKISFDHLGRPLVGDISGDTTAYPSGRLMTAKCTITISDGTDSSIIDIEPETGYTHIR